MEIHIQKDTTISLHKQLVTQISMQIAAGLLKPGVKLPSIRGLSQKLGIHHNTCLSAYRELDEIGLIELRHGSGARVALLAEGGEPSAIPEAPELDKLAEFFVREITRRGYAWEDAQNALDAARSHLGRQVRQPLVFVDIHRDILPLFQAELQHALKRPVQAVTLSQLNPDTVRDSHFVVSRYHVQALREKLRTAPGHSAGEALNERITVIDVGSGQQELALIKQMPTDALAAVFSSSTIILQQAEAVVKALRGDEIYIRPILSGQETAAEVQRVLKRAKIIFADWINTPQLAALTRKPIHTIRVVPDLEMDKLKAFRAD